MSGELKEREEGMEIVNDFEKHFYLRG